MGTEAWLAVGFGFVFVTIIAGVAVWITVRDRQPPQAAMFLFRVIIALAAAGVGAVLPGMLDVNLTGGGLTIRAACGFGLFVLIYLVNPPGRFASDQASSVPRVGPVRKGIRRDAKGP